MTICADLFGFNMDYRVRFLGGIQIISQNQDYGLFVSMAEGTVIYFSVLEWRMLVAVNFPEVYNQDNDCRFMTS